jgi:hypothetical protein
VEFVKERTVECVPQSWLVNIHECRWPPKGYDVQKLKRLQRLGIPSKDSWPSHAVKVLTVKGMCLLFLTTSC